jgi:NAD(P)-dependent dehydrogenase (short-subunit alcohol dehydrogenase family)
MRVAVIGATGVIGTEVVKALSKRHEVVRCGRTTADFAVDISSSESIRDLFEAIGPVDGVVCTAGDNRFGPLDELSDDDYAFGFASKLMGQVNVVRIGHPYVLDSGAITLTSGVTGRKPIVGTTSIGMVNCAVEGFVRAAALELPRGLRINAVCPEWTTETLTLYGMDPSWGIPAERVALGYVESVEGTSTGTVIDTGWRHDPTVGSETIAVA